MRSVLILFMTTMLCAAQGADTFNVTRSTEKHALGLKRTEKSKKFLELKKSAKRAILTGAAPGKYDLTAKVSPPENQGQCGSCWDFGITKALRSALMLAGNDPGTLAFNYLLDNCGNGPSQGGCNGGDFDAGESFLKGNGPWLESEDPYQGYETSCKSGLTVAGTALTYETVGNGGVPSFQELALALSQNHMLVVDVAVCGAWENYSSGIFNQNQCGASSINHIINMVGYDCETSVDSSGNCTFDSNGEPSNGDGYVIAMNNWGTSWGENGYMRTRTHMDALANTAMYFTVAVPSPSPVPSPSVSPVPSISPTPGPTPPNPTQTPLWIMIVAVLGIFGIIFGVYGLIKKHE